MLSYRLDELSELRLLQAHHAEALYALADRNRTHLRQWLTWVDSAHDVSFIFGFGAVLEKPRIPPPLLASV